MRFTGSNVQSGKRLSRRDFLKLLKTGAIDLALLAAGGGIYSFLVEPGLVRVESVSLKLRRLTSGFSGIRMAQISDIHMGGWMNAEHLQNVVNLVVAQKPDVLLFTGDFLIGHVFDADSEQAVRDLITILTPLAASFPSFAILGNHDYWTNPEAVREVLRSCNIADLTNTVFTMTRGAEKLHLCGVDDIWEGDVRMDNVLGQIANDGAAILLAHEPDFADTSAATGRFDLQVSGHSHGGQVVIPFIGPPILPYLGRKYPSGLYQVGKMYQYTSRGVGMGRLPVRFNCPPEITLFILDGDL
ncbi:MAG TPA: metallophosphoesterase [Anaerolineales bacterium]|nr:metallophosphoesterase [Anaerolineales bacterium]